MRKLKIVKKSLRWLGISSVYDRIAKQTFSWPSKYWLVQPYWILVDFVVCSIFADQITTADSDLTWPRLKLAHFFSVFNQVNEITLLTVFISSRSLCCDYSNCLNNIHEINPLWFLSWSQNYTAHRLSKYSCCKGRIDWE